MANDNHEYYNSEEICTYTDAITISNPLTEEQVNAAVLSAGVPYDAANAWIKVETSTALDEPNSNNPFENGPSGLAVIHNTSELIEIPVTNYERYYHVIYRANSAVATALSVKKYRNVLTITPRTATIGAATVNFYEWTITTQYGAENDWTNSALSPQRVINVSGDLSTISMSGHHDQIFGQSEFSGLGGRYVIGKYITALSAMNGGTTTPTNAPYNKADDWDYSLQSQTDYHVEHNTYYDKWVIGHDQGGGGGFHAYGMILITSIDFILMQCAICGLKFHYDGTDYKPIVTGGVVTGYTSDMTEESEWDNWNNIGDHTIPVDPTPVPPTPTPDEDDIDDHKMGAGTGISGMANLWLLTKSQLNDLHSAFNNAPGGFDPMNSLISVMGLGVAPTYLMDDIQYITPINIRKSDGTSWSTGVEAHIVDAQKSAFQFTGITVNRKYNNFLDFSPYAIHEIFIPMCGWLTLPDIAVDRSITVTYLPDIESLKCRAVVSVVDNSGHRCVIGEKDGIMGADVPFTNTGHSLYVGEAIINGMNVAGEVITGAIGAGFTKTNAKGGTYRPYEGFTVGMSGTLPGAIGNAIVSGQTNRTHFMTGNGTRIGFSDGENIQIKSIYHDIDKPTNYDHTVGKVCNKTGQLSNFSGFTVCDNPHINISALEEEKSEIKALLEQGVILPSGE